MQHVLHRAHLSDGISEAHVGSGAGDHAGHVASMLVNGVGRGNRQVRNPDLHLSVGIREGGGKNADHGVGLGIEMNLPPNNIGIAIETALEEAPGKHYCVALRIVVRFGKCSSQCWPHAEHGKEI